MPFRRRVYRRRVVRRRTARRRPARRMVPRGYKLQRSFVWRPGQRYRHGRGSFFDFLKHVATGIGQL